MKTPLARFKQAGQLMETAHAFLQDALLEAVSGSHPETPATSPVFSLMKTLRQLEETQEVLSLHYSKVYNLGKDL